VESWASLPYDEAANLREVGSTALTGEPGRSTFEKIWARPTLEVHGIAGGFTGAGAKTVIPAKAVAKVSLRLVPHQDPDAVVAAFRQWGYEPRARQLSTGGREVCVAALRMDIRCASSRRDTSRLRNRFFDRQPN
jgi:hypothetical protein